MSDDDRELAERLARLHANDPSFRSEVREHAPKLHAILAEDERSRGGLWVRLRAWLRTLRRA